MGTEYLVQEHATSLGPESLPAVPASCEKSGFCYGVLRLAGKAAMWPIAIVDDVIHPKVEFLD